MLDELEVGYLRDHRHGRLATVRPDGTPQNNPVSAYYNLALGVIDIAGQNMSASKKFRNVRSNGNVALVVDDVASYRPLNVRCLEIRGHAEAIDEPTDSAARMPGAIIRIHPRRVISFGLAPEAEPRTAEH